MKANELRIGNYIRNEVQGINFKVNSVVIHRLCFGDSEGYSPIKLTEEILLKIKGHEKRPTSVIFDRFRLVYKPEYKFWYLFDYELKTYLTKVEFLHEYQNVIYVLNGIELEIKL